MILPQLQTFSTLDETLKLQTFESANFKYDSSFLELQHKKKTTKQTNKKNIKKQKQVVLGSTIKLFSFWMKRRILINLRLIKKLLNIVSK